MTETTTKTPTKEPRNTLYVQRWADLANQTEAARYLVEDENGDSHTITVSKNMRRILDTLMLRPIYCASRCRVSHYINVLRHELRVKVETDRYKNDPASGRMSYGVFRLVSKVTRISSQGVQS